LLIFPARGPAAGSSEGDPVVTDDRVIPPPAQRAMAERAGATVVEVPGSHAIYESQPGLVADLVKQVAAAL
jgi:pimeloyl-ACP methyl ester carboxylesterase